MCFQGQMIARYRDIGRFLLEVSCKSSQHCSLAGASTAAKPEENSLIHIDERFQSVPPPKRNKETFLAAVATFKENKHRGHVEFINTALKYLKDYGIHKDLDVYKVLLNVFPKGKMIPQNSFQRIFLHYPMQQQCCVKVLDEMEWHGVHPDKEIHDIVVNAFGEWNFATKKIKRMLYWMPKLRYTNKYLDRRNVEGKSLTPAELAGVALKMMCPDPGTAVSLVRIAPNGLENDAWFAFAQSVTQKNLIREIPDNGEVFIDGPFNVYVMEHKVQYVAMTCEPLHVPGDEFKHETLEEDFSNWFTEWKNERYKRNISVHEQKHETILALGAMHRNDNKTASLWFERLQEENPSLSRLKPRLRLERGLNSTAEAQ
ncbi:Evolutionarily conserved signaling intermediate in Toll pathway mitochondrial [Trichostrongylus colubriformis]|uniref:Evolutionarily conserved signaling intermediate in Toll pathway, mitochondrial n=1 Tax=Trichostrongylus colubriformis TaxID=6319 RepID=A0AAN8G1K1_TRICO